MPGGAYSVYASDVAEAIQGAVLSYASPSINIQTGSTANYWPVVAPMGMNLAGILVYASVVATPNAATAVVANSDQLDLILSGYEVTNAVGGGVRCKVITRKGAEEAERLYLQPPTTTVFVYPRASAATFTATTAATTQQVYFYIPCAGGQAVNVRLSYPGAGSTYSTTASITSLTATYYLYAVPTLSSVKTAYQEIQSRSLGAGQQDVREMQPDGMAADLCSVVGTGWGTSSTTLGKIVIDGQGGIGRTVDWEDNYAPNAAQTLYPPTSAANQTNALFNMHKQRADHLWLTTNASFSGTVNTLFAEIDDGSSLTPVPQAAATASPSLAQSTASAGPGGAGVVPNRAGGLLAGQGGAGGRMLARKVA